jgi:PBP1b-binding outer membrane lipoprotein LpoB
MRRLAALASVALLLVSCSPEGDATGSTNKCAASLYPSYNSKNLEQCVAVCIKCDNGSTTTCSTSCTLQGAR